MVIVSAMSYPPRLTVTPAPGSVVSDVVELRVTSSEPLKRVEFWFNGHLMGTDTSTPYTWVWDTLPLAEGEHVVTVRATDMNDRVLSTEVRYVVRNDLSRGGAYYLERAREHLSSQRWEDALKAARRAVRLLPDDGQAHHLLAQAWLGTSQWSKAVESAEQAAKRLPSPDTLATLAQAHLQVAFAQTVDQEKRFASLQAAVDSAVRAGDMRLSHTRSSAERARALAQLGRLEEAAETYLQAGSTADNLLAAARCYLLAGRWQDADRMCNLAERRAADKTTIGVYRALAQALRGRNVEARQRLEQLSQTALVTMARANVALRERKPSEAIRILLPLRTQGTVSDVVDTLIMTALAETRDFARAEDHFRDALLRNPLNWLALAQKGYETLAVGSTATARRYFELAARIRPDDAWVLCGQALCAEDRSRAVQLAQQAAKQAPDNPWTLVVLSSVQWRAGQLDEAMRHIERARNLDRDNYNFGSPPDVRRAGQIARILGRRPALPLE
jgi:tetratricopeptide (TPR) repeat protein